MGKNEKSVNSNIDRRRITETEEMNKTEEIIENQVKDAVIKDINVRDINAEVKEAEAAAEANAKEIEEKTKKSKKTKKEKAEKKPFKERFQLGLKQMLIYFAIIAGSIILLSNKSGLLSSVLFILCSRGGYGAHRNQRILSPESQPFCIPVNIAFGSGILRNPVGIFQNIRFFVLHLHDGYGNGSSRKLHVGNGGSFD